MKTTANLPTRMAEVLDPIDQESDRVGNPGSCVAVCVATYKRPRGLARLLDGLSEQAFARVPRPTFEVIVVDNDEARSAEGVVAEAARRLPCPVRYVVEPRRGISYARNAAVQAALAGRFALVAFIDDDERPVPHWLDELLAALDEFGADVVAGPVEPRFEEPDTVPGWVIRGGFFDRPEFASGTPLQHVATGNVVICARVFDGVGGGFDERLALTGGEDTEFFIRVRRAGYRIVWENRARVLEWQPRSRVSATWIVRRAYRTSVTWAQCERRLGGSPRAYALRALKGVWFTLTGALVIPCAAVRGRHVAVRGLTRVARGVGYLAALGGAEYAEYTTVHGA